MSKKIDWSGVTQGCITVLGCVGYVNGKTRWQVRCENCGKVYDLAQSALARGTKSCYDCRGVLGEINSSHKAHYRNYKRGAEKRGLEFELSLEEFYAITQENCYFCDTEPKQIVPVKSLPPTTAVGVDRYDNSKGYTIDNARPCCWECNRMKGTSNGDEFIAHVNKLATHLLKVI
jgi:hypothetical protein